MKLISINFRIFWVRSQRLSRFTSGHRHDKVFFKMNVKTSLPQTTSILSMGESYQFRMFGRVFQKSDFLFTVFEREVGWRKKPW